MKTYLFRRWIDGAWYSGRVACRDWQDADEWCRRAGAHLDGELIASIPAVVPGTCTWATSARAAACSCRARQRSLRDEPPAERLARPMRQLPILVWGPAGGTGSSRPVHALGNFDALRRWMRRF